ncbi:MAG: GntR family transcriptional regulator [Rhodobacteraceae bacterium]|nr:GntR family transcriptional regulator [Paracoccaceae bacterium]
MAETGALPLHMQISELLIRDIAAGRLVDGERLPPEREMAARHGISIGTLRKALAALQAQGMLERVQGSGNYIRSGPDPGRGSGAVYAFLRLELAEGGGLPTARVLSVDRLPKDPALPEFGSDPQGHRIRRLRFLSGTVAAVEEIWLDGAQTPVLKASDLSESLYHFYSTRLGLRIARAEDRVGQGPLPDWAPSAFPYPPGTALPMITRVSHSHDGAAVEASWTWFDPQHVRYTVRLR